MLNAVGIDVAKRKSTVTIRRPGDEIILPPCDIRHNRSEINDLITYIKSLKGPLDNTEYVAIGGVSPENLTDFFRQGYIGVGLGSSILPKDAVAARDWEACSKYVAGMMEKIRNL